MAILSNLDYNTGMKKAQKCYRNADFLRSASARSLRILAEYLEPKKRFEDHQVKNTVVFFGSARVSPRPSPGAFDHSSYYQAAEEFAYRLGQFSRELERGVNDFAICTGGGPGIMEAANKGATRARVPSIGLNISLPLEQYPNDFITPSLNFEFHYFFMRKLWFLYHAKAIVFFPGGYGTLDELFETLTLVQTRKYDKYQIPILLYDRDYWMDLINFEMLVSRGYISAGDTDYLHFFSSVDEGMTLIKPLLLKSIKQYSKG